MEEVDNEKLGALLDKITPENENLSRDLKEFEHTMPYGLLYRECIFIKKLIERGFFQKIIALDKIVDKLSIDDIKILSMIANKFTSDSGVFSDHKYSEDIVQYADFLIKMSILPGIDIQTSHNFNSKAVFLLTCVDPSSAIDKLWEITVGEKEKGRYFNAGHAMLDWLYCVQDFDHVDEPSIILVFEITEKCFKEEENMTDSQITIGFCKSTIWLLSNLNYFFTNSTDNRKRIYEALDHAHILTPHFLRNYYRTINITTKRTLETREWAYYKKGLNMLSTSSNILLKSVHADSLETVINILASCCPIGRPEDLPGLYNLDEPLRIGTLEAKKENVWKQMNEVLGNPSELDEYIINHHEENDIIRALYACLTITSSPNPFMIFGTFLFEKYIRYVKPLMPQYSRCMSLARVVWIQLQTLVEQIRTKETRDTQEIIINTLKSINEIVYFHL